MLTSVKAKMSSGQLYRVVSLVVIILRFVDLASLYICVIKTNLMHYLSSVYFVIQPLHVSGIFVAHHQEVYCIYILYCMCIYIYIYIYTHNNWYVLCFLDDCLLAGLPGQQTVFFVLFL